MEHRAIVNGLLPEQGEIVAAQNRGCSVLYALPHGILVSGSRLQLARLEKKGCRVKLLKDVHLLEIGEHRINTNSPEDADLTADQKQSWLHYLIQFIAPPFPEWIEELIRMGIEVVEPVSAFGLFVVCGEREITKAAELPYVSWVGPFLPKHRIHQSLQGLRGCIRYVNIAVYPPSALDSVKRAVNTFGGSVVRTTVPPHYYRGQYGEILAEIDASFLQVLAYLPEVRWLEFSPPAPGVEGEREVQITAGNLDSYPYPQKGPLPGYAGWLKSLGLTGGSGVRIALCDTGLEMQNTNREEHLDLLGRQQSFVNYSHKRYPKDYLTHGTHIASIAVGSAVTGQKDEDGFLWGQGVAPRAEVISQNILVGPWPADWQAVVQGAAARGAQVINNSWCAGKSPGEGYSLAARTFDRLVCDALPGTAVPHPVTMVFSAGNAGPGNGTITPPKESKNTIVVGNSLGYQPEKRFGCSDIRGIFGTSSRGPARDGRLMPTIVAPGTDVSAARATGSGLAPIPGTGEVDYLRPGIRKHEYVCMTGTSMSAALVSGACALLIEWWRRRSGGKDPSPALLKALLVIGAENQFGGHDWRSLNGTQSNNSAWTRLNSGVYCRPLEFKPLRLVSKYSMMTESSCRDGLMPGQWHYCPEEEMLYVRLAGNCSPLADDALLLNALAPEPLGNHPDNTQGWGRINLNNIFLQSPAVMRGPKIILDCETTLRKTGAEFLVRVAACDPRLPLRVTLAWTDPPAAVGSGNTLVNDLDLEVRETRGRKRLFKGNALRRGYSRTGSDYDSTNNVECVFLQHPDGVYEVRVVAAALRGLAKPPFGCLEQEQDFALVIENARCLAQDSTSMLVEVEQRDQQNRLLKELGATCRQSVALCETALSNNGSLPALVEEGAEEATFAIYWPDTHDKLVFNPKRENEIGVRLFDPDGFPVHPNTSWLHREYGTGYAICRIKKPRPGYWRLALLSAEETEIFYTACAYITSDLQLHVEASAGTGCFHMRACVTDKGLALSGWHAAAKIRDTLLTEVRFRPEDKGDWQAATIFFSGNEPVDVVIRADGISPVSGSPFCRYQMVSLFEPES